MNSMVMSKIDLRSLVRDIVRQWMTILLLSVSVGMLTYVYLYYRYIPQYTTTTTFVVSDSANVTRNYKNMESATEIAERFKFVLEGQLLQKAVCEDLNLSWFPATTTVTQVTDTNMIEMSVTANSPELAFRIMHSIMNNYSQVSDFVVGSVDLNVLQDPLMPNGPSNYQYNSKMIMRNVLIAFIMLCVIFGLLSLQRSTVKNTEQYKSKIDAYPLGVVYHERKLDKQLTSPIGKVFIDLMDLLQLPFLRPSKTVSMLIDNPMRSFFYVESNRMVANRIRSRMDKKSGKVAMITSVYENEGKSTVSANLALALAKDGKRVLLIDMDLRRPCQYKIFQVPEDQRVELIESIKDMSLFENLPTQYKDTSLYLLANSQSAKESDGHVSLQELKKLIDFYRTKMDYILLDTSPMALVTDTEAMASLSDGAILVVREDVVPVRQINDTIDILTGSGTQMYGCVFNDAHQVFISDHVQNKSYRGYYGRD